MTATISPLTLSQEGAQLFSPALGVATLHALTDALANQPPDHAGVRLFGVTALRSFLAPGGPIGAVAASALGSGCRPVRAILFDKTAANNWALGWHQDRVIAVAERMEVEGFGPWSRKGGVPHVAPPAEVLAGMVTLRVHLGDVAASNAPLLIAPGSHTLGRIAERDVRATVARCGTFACVAKAGDIWLYATPILHASEAATQPARRRVLQVDFASGDLPGGLKWLGV